MDTPVIRLTTERELKIFMDPVRQRVLRTMEILGRPVTAKGLADAMGMTPASAKYHLGQLESIGLAALDHTELIHGITARYYRATRAEVRLGAERSEFRAEAEIIAENQVNAVFRAFLARAAAAGEGDVSGDCHTGVVRLTEEQLRALREKILSFIRESQTGPADAAPYEFALVYCRAETGG